MHALTNYSTNQLKRAFAFEQEAKLPQAQRLCQAFLKKHPQDSRARYLQAKLYHRLNDLVQAERFAEMLVKSEPEMPDAIRLYAHILVDRFQVKKAFEYALTLIDVEPKNATNYAFVAHLSSLQGRNEEALTYLNTARSFAPDDADIEVAQIAVVFAQGKFGQTIRYCKSFVERHGQREDIWEFWAVSLLKVGRHAEIFKILDVARHESTQGRRLRFHWMYHTIVPVLYQNVEELEKYKIRYLEGLKKVAEYATEQADLKADHEILARRPWENFYFAYQGVDVRESQEIRADILRRYVGYLAPQYLELDASVYKQREGKIRVGYVSGHLHTHTVGMYWFGNYIAHDRSRFEFYGYYVGGKSDRFLRDYSEDLDKFVCLDGSQPLLVAEELQKDQLDVIIYPDVGMESITAFLCVMRLAPIQCAQYGHPITTGSKYIDFYLSGELVEPDNAQEHYTETLVKFPNIALNYQYGLIPKVNEVRDTYGLPEDVFLFASTQSTFKYLPQYDWIYPAILSQTDAKIVFVSNPDPDLTNKFIERMTAAFAEYGLDFSQRCIVLPRVGSLPLYLGLMQCCDVMLDTPMWAGGRTTLEGISQGLPVITWPGPYMRAAFTAGILKMIDYQDTIVSSLEEYVQTAVRVAQDKNEYQRLVDKMKQNHHLAFDDESFVSSLENFLEQQVLIYRDKLKQGVELFD